MCLMLGKQARIYARATRRALSSTCIDIPERAARRREQRSRGVRRPMRIAEPRAAGRGTGPSAIVQTWVTDGT